MAHAAGRDATVGAAVAADDGSAGVALARRGRSDPGPARRVAVGGPPRPVGVRRGQPVRRRRWRRHGPASWPPRVIGRWRHTHDVQRRGGEDPRARPDRDSRSPPRRCGRRSSTGTASSSTTSLPTATPPTRASSRWSIAVTGASGLVGSALTRVAHHRRAPGHPAGAGVRQGRRRAAVEPASARRRPARRRRRRGAPGRASIAGRFTDGAPDGDPRTAASSRPAGSPKCGAPRTDGPRTFVSASAIGFYGFDRGDAQLTEDSSRGDGFLADVVADWEAATTPAVDAGCGWCWCGPGSCRPPRVARCDLLRPLFTAGLGGRLAAAGSGCPGSASTICSTSTTARCTTTGSADRSTRSVPNRSATSTTPARWPVCCTGRRYCPVPSLGPAAAAGRAGRPRTRRGEPAGGAVEAVVGGPPFPSSGCR